MLKKAVLDYWIFLLKKIETLTLNPIALAGSISKNQITAVHSSLLGCWKGKNKQNRCKRISQSEEAERIFEQGECLSLALIQLTSFSFLKLLFQFPISVVP